MAYKQLFLPKNTIPLKKVNRLMQYRLLFAKFYPFIFLVRDGDYHPDTLFKVHFYEKYIITFFKTLPFFTFKKEEQVIFYNARSSSKRFVVKAYSSDIL